MPRGGFFVGESLECRGCPSSPAVRSSYSGFLPFVVCFEERDRLMCKSYVCIRDWRRWRKVEGHEGSM